MFNATMAAGSNYELEKALRELDSSDSIPVTTGQVYVVVPTSFAGYTEFYNKYQKIYADGQSRIQSTLAAAITACVANRDDVIYVSAGYALTVTASNVDFSKAGVTVIGLGNGLKRPTLTYGAAAATVTISAANVTIKNFHHIANFADVASAYTLSTAKDFRLQNNTFVDAGADLNFFNIVVTNATSLAASGLTVVDNNWHNIDANAKAFISILATLNYLVVKDNVVVTGATSNIAYFITSSSFAMLDVQILRNKLIAAGATGATAAIFLTGTGVSTGIVEGNRIASLDTTTELIFDVSTALRFYDNLYTGVADKSGYIVPAIDSAA